MAFGAVWILIFGLKLGDSLTKQTRCGREIVAVSREVMAEVRQQKIVLRPRIGRVARATRCGTPQSHLRHGRVANVIPKNLMA